MGLLLWIGPDGLGCLGCDADPGWRPDEVDRQILLYHAAAVADPLECLPQGPGVCAVPAPALGLLAAVLLPVC